MFPKPKRIEDKNYLAWICTLPCIICNRLPTIYHHVYTGGMGTKCSDYKTIPLCDDHHMSGNDAIHKGTESFSLKFDIDYDRLIEKLNNEYKERL